jgi:uncharacterized protein (TIGR02145 family)
MATRMNSGLVFFSLYFLSQTVFSQIRVEGFVTDTESEPVENALVELIDQEDSSRTFSSYTNQQGRYEIQIAETGVDNDHPQRPATFTLLQNYPNPFNPSTVIEYRLEKQAHITIEVFNVLGHKIKTLFDGFQSHPSGRIVWDATDDRGKGVAAGVYIYSLTAEGIRINRKMLLIDGQRGNSHWNITSKTDFDVSSPMVLNKRMSDRYLLRVTGDDIETYEQSDLTITNSTVLDIIVKRAALMDVDGNVYKIVKIGSQWWMAENLKVTRYRNGEAITVVTDPDTWSTLTTGAYCNYDNDEANVATYGRLYNWYAVTNSRRVAPQGWHVPSDDEWKQLEMTLGMSQSDADGVGNRGTNEGGKLKEIGTAHWNEPNEGAVNESGFAALPGGQRIYSGIFNLMGLGATFWSSTEFNDERAWHRSLYYEYSDVTRNSPLKNFGFSLRCVRD